MFTALVALAVLVGTLLVKRYLQRLRANPKRLPYPPGPKPLPVIGNALDLPSSYHWIAYAEWAKTYGDVMHVQAFGQHFVILNSAEAVDDLLEKRSGIYSDRPRMPMSVELMGWTWLLTAMPYGIRWRRHHRILHQYFHSEKVSLYRPVQLLEARRLLFRLLESPEGFQRHIQQAFTATIMNVVYGFELKNTRHRFVEVAKEAVRAAGEAAVPGAYLVDILPALKYIPEWFPGANFKRTARYLRDLLPFFVDEPYETSKKQSVSKVSALGFFEQIHLFLPHTRQQASISKPSIVSDALESRVGEDVNEDYETDVKEIAATAFVGGADTTRSTMETLFFALMLRPDIQRKAQEQLDKVVGRERLPDFDDLEQCPLVRAIIMETLRWQPVLPLAVPHSVTVDDEYRGYYIPKGSFVIGNVWAISHEEGLYPNPYQFFPERFLCEDGSYNHSAQSHAVAAFGFGRRKCPGRHFALDGALMTAASILACFDISRPPGDDADEIDYEADGPSKCMVSGSPVVSYPLPFKCSIRPRSGATASLIKQTVQCMEDTE